MNWNVRSGRRRLLNQMLGLILSATFSTHVQSTEHFDPRDFDDLSQVIMLCATEPQSERFAATWQHWVEANPEADVNEAVREVVSRAGTFRGMAIPGMEPVRHGRRPDPAALADYMLSLAASLRSGMESGGGERSGGDRLP